MSKKYLFIFQNKTHLLIKERFLVRTLSYRSHTKSSNNWRNGLNCETNKNAINLLFNGRQCPTLSLIGLNMSSTTQPIDALTYERIADQTLDHLNEELELIIESNSELKESDVSLNNGVITLNLGLHGVYVINKQTPNRQIWFSSPLSGPKRYDYLNSDWVYKRDGNSLISLLSSELSVFLKREIKIKNLVIK